MHEKLHMLLVDHEPDSLRAASSLLSDVGHEVMQATTAREALQWLERDQPDLILLDVMLPDTDGVELCRRIRTDSGRSSCRVILISGDGAASEVVADGLEAGADEYIKWPISGRELLARVRAIARRANALTELASAETCSMASTGGRARESRPSTTPGRRWCSKSRKERHGEAELFVPNGLPDSTSNDLGSVSQGRLLCRSVLACAEWRDRVQFASAEPTGRGAFGPLSCSRQVSRPVRSDIPAGSPRAAASSTAKERRT